MILFIPWKTPDFANLATTVYFRAYSFFSFTVYWRSGRLCPDRPQHSVQDSSRQPAHHSRSFAVWGRVCPFCTCELWQSYRSGHQWASSDQPDRSVHLSTSFSVLCDRVSHKINVEILMCCKIKLVILSNSHSSFLLQKFLKEV